MSNITEMELQNIRHLLLSSQTDEAKYCSYAENCNDPKVKQFFENSSQSAVKNKQTLLQFLQ